MVRTAILGVGHYVPEKVVTNDDLAKLFETSDEWIQQRTGIKERRFISESGTGASDLAVPAVKMACERAGVAVSEIECEMLKYGPPASRGLPAGGNVKACGGNSFWVKRAAHTRTRPRPARLARRASGSRRSSSRRCA